jgi:thiol:disulfide interchange protein DsbD
MRRLTAWILGCLVLAGGSLGAQTLRTFDPDKDVTLAFKKSSVVVTVPQGAHLKAAFMEVALKPGTPGRLKVGPMPATTAKDELGEGIWRDRVVIPIAGDGLPASTDLVVTYQPCTEGSGGVCYPPTDRTLTVKAAEVTPAVAKALNPAAPEVKASEPQAVPLVAAGPAAVPAAPAPTPAPAPAREGLFWLFLGAFGFGLLASLTPCVYPMIPITMAIIGAKGGGKARGFALSFTLVLGMAVTYTTLGVLAARTGAAFGAFAQTPGFLIPVSVIFALFALSLFGAFEISLPDALQSRLQGGNRTGFTGAFLMGLVLGPLSAPCVGPFIGTVMVAIAKDGRVLLGAAELFTFAMGMGVLFMAVGTFSAALPRSGNWMVRLKQIMGLVVLAFAVWNIRLVVPQWLLFSLASLTLFLAAPLAGAFESADDLPGGLRKGLGYLALILGLLLGIRAVETGLQVELLPRGGAAVADAPKGNWMEQDLEGALAKANGKLVIVDTYAEWCAQCKELDEKTWPDPQVTAWLKDNAVAVRIDMDKVRKDLAKRYGIQGYPTVLVLDGQGRELRRVMGFQKPAEMLRFLKG